MSSDRFAGKVALVTGASGGIGPAIARLLSAGGAAVACHYHRNRDGAEDLARELEAGGGRAMAVGGDLADGADATQIAGAVAEAFGGIDILVNNAGISTMLAFGEVTAESFTAEFNANVLSVILMTQAAVAHFPASGGRVVNVATNLSYKPIPGLTVYSAAKAAVITLTQGYAHELGPRRIAVNAVAPGATHTPMTAWMPDDLVADLSAATPLGRLAQPGDVASVVAFLASDEAGWVNGRTILVDGGLT